jgi:HSP20 family protein
MLSREFNPFGSSWDPWRELERLQTELNRHFADPREAFAQEYPRVNVWTHESGATVSALVPGVDAKALDISVLGESVTIRGKVQEEPVAEGTAYHRRERSQGAFSRTVTVPFRIDANGVSASYKNGILEVELPRSPEERPKRIAISGK